MVDNYLTHTGYGDEYLKVIASVAGFYICINYSSNHNTYNYTTINVADIDEYTVHYDDVYSAFGESEPELINFLSGEN
ncbi:MAG: hypothetical protein ACRC92_24065 [Peptostreptococcaceae bacterium]